MLLPVRPLYDPTGAWLSPYAPYRAQPLLGVSAPYGLTSSMGSMGPGSMMVPSHRSPQPWSTPYQPGPQASTAKTAAFLNTTDDPRLKPKPLSKEATKGGETLSSTAHAPSPQTERRGDQLHFLKHTLRVGGLFNEIAQAIKPYCRWVYNPLNWLTVAYMGVTAVWAGLHGAQQARDNPKLSNHEVRLTGLRNGVNEAGFQFLVNMFVPPIAIEATNQLIKTGLNGGHFHLGTFLHEVQREVFLVNQFRNQTQWLRQWPNGPGMKVTGLYHRIPGLNQQVSRWGQWADRQPMLGSFLRQMKNTALKIDGVRLKHRIAMPQTLVGLGIIAAFPMLDRSFERFLSKTYQPMVNGFFNRLNHRPLAQPLEHHSSREKANHPEDSLRLKAVQGRLSQTL